MRTASTAYAAGAARTARTARTAYGLRGACARCIAKLAAGAALLTACGPGGDGGDPGEPSGGVGDAVPAVEGTAAEPAGAMAPTAAAADTSDSATGISDAAADTADALFGDTAAVVADDAPPPPPVLIPSGTLVTVASEVDISTSSHRVGDPVEAVVVADVVDRVGAVLIPRGARFLGRVHASAGSGGVGEPAILEIGFETLSAWSYERPIETLVVEAGVSLDLNEDIERRLSRDPRRSLSIVAGRIVAGSRIRVEVREPVLVPGDSLGNAIGRPDSTGAGPTSPPRALPF